MSRPIAVSAWDLASPRGVGRWLREVLGAWRTLGLDTEATLYLEGPLPAGFDPGRFAIRSLGAGRASRVVAWEQLRLPAALSEDRPRVLLGPAGSLPLVGRTPGVMVIHDLSFEAHPEWFSLREGTRRRVLARLSARRARRLIAVSQFTARETLARYGVRRERLRVVPNGVAEALGPVEDPVRLEALRKLHGLEGDFVLSVGSLFNRRHPLELLAAFAAVAAERPGLRLVLVGEDRTYPRLDLVRRIPRLGLADRLLWLDRVSEEELAGLYTLARVVVYLSDYEGFGLPPLEALACGAPVLASRRTALTENLEGRALLVDDHEPGTIAGALLRLLDGARPPAKRPAWLEAYSWTAAARAVHEVLREVAG